MAAPTLFPLKIIYFNENEAETENIVEDDDIFNIKFDLDYDILMDPGIGVNNALSSYIDFIRKSNLIEIPSSVFSLGNF